MAIEASLKGVGFAASKASNFPGLKSSGLVVWGFKPGPKQSTPYSTAHAIWSANHHSRPTAVPRINHPTILAP